MIETIIGIVIGFMLLYVVFPGFVEIAVMLTTIGVGGLIIAGVMGILIKIFFGD